MPTVKCKLSALKLDLLNVRTGTATDERDALQKLIADQEMKLANLAAHILDRGLSPGESIWVMNDEEAPGRHVVLEGNRRVAALKLMENPLLAAGTSVADRFGKLAKEFAKKPIRMLDATVFASRDDAQEWIDLRHMSSTSGVALQQWRRLAKAKSLVGKGSMPRSLAVLIYLDDDTEEFARVATVINEKASTLERVFNHPAMKDVLGITIDRKTGKISFDDGDDLAGARVLRQMIAAMGAADFKFSVIRDEGDREAFIRKFSTKPEGDVEEGGPDSGRPDGHDRAGSGPKTSEPSPEGGAPPKPASEATGSTSPRRQSDAPRKTLAPSTAPKGAFNVKAGRLAKIYKECREIELKGNENAAALLLRVFLELSSEALLIHKKVPIPSKKAGSPVKTHWGEIGISLDDKIGQVVSLIDVDAGTAKALKAVRVARSDKNVAGSIDTLHAYMHNASMNPDVDLLRAGWDTWEPYLKLLYAQLS